MQDNTIPTDDPSPAVQEGLADPHRLARAFKRSQEIDGGGCGLRYWRGEFWRWDGQRYRPVSQEDLTALLTTKIKVEFDRHATLTGETPKPVYGSTVRNARQALVSMVRVPSEKEQPLWLTETDDEPHRIALTNGLLDVDRLLRDGHATLEPHTPKWFSPTCLPYEYDARATCPRWEAFVDEVLEGDVERIQLLQEGCGYCLIFDTRQQKFFVLEGDGANGKSVVLEVLQGLVGEDNVSHVPLEMFGQRFQLTPTIGKLINVASEVGDLDRLAEGTLKQFTAGDRMYFDRKGISGIEAYPTARLVVAANNRPHFRDRSQGLWRRMILLPFGVTIPESQQDKHLAERLLTELPGIFNWSVIGLRRLRERGHFAVPAVCQDLLKEYQRESNPAKAFLQERCRSNLRAHVPTQQLYRDYSDFCRDSVYRALGEAQFGKEVKRVFPRVRRQKRGSRKQRSWVYTGIVRP